MRFRERLNFVEEGVILCFDMFEGMHTSDKGEIFGRSEGDRVWNNSFKELYKILFLKIIKNLWSIKGFFREESSAIKEAIKFDPGVFVRVWVYIIDPIVTREINTDMNRERSVRIERCLYRHIYVPKGLK